VTALHCVQLPLISVSIHIRSSLFPNLVPRFARRYRARKSVSWA
jgi:hypothetical protein